MRAAAVYNVAWWAANGLFPNAYFSLVGIPAPSYPSIWQALAMIVGVYGLLYWWAGDAPGERWPVIAVGLFGKLLGPMGFLWAASRGELPWAFGWTLLSNDLLWLTPFAWVLWHTAIRPRRAPEAGRAASG